MSMIPLTFAQESIYFLNDLTNGRPVYHMPQAFRLRGKLDTAALEASLRKAVARHEALRTAIVSTPDGPRQFGQDSEFRLARHRVNESEFPERLADAIAEPFDLQSGQPFRADLFEFGEENHLLLLNLHHAVGDMSSLGILFRELSAAYAGQNLDGRVTQNSEYARRRRTVEPDEATRTFWRETLRHFTEDLELPTDRQRPRLPSFAGEAIYYEFPADLTSGLKQLARAQRCSLYMVCLAALQALIFRYTGQSKFCISTPFSDRDDAAFENTIGYLINLLPVPCEVNRDQPFNSLLESVRNKCLEAYSHNGISFRQILKELNLASDSPKPPLARVVFQYFPEMPELELAGLQCEPVRVHSRTSKFDLCFSLFEHQGTITAEIEYDTDLFDETSAAGWGAHFEALLRSILANPSETTGALNIMSPGERELLARWSGAAAEYPREGTVHQLFEEQAASHPEAIAVVDERGQLSYRELNERANSIAAELRGRGVNPGDYVGVCLKRSPDLVAALLGILKAGAAFVPFEANYPKARLEYLFRDSGVRLLVTDSRHARIAPAGTDLLLLAPGTKSEFAAKGTATDVAYVMYTSGSTGDPKGVMVPHRAIVRLVKNNDFASFGPSEVWLAFAPVSFDASTLEIWAPLLNGGTLAIYPPEFQSVEQFEAVIKQFGVTSLWLTAGLFNTIVDQKAGALRGVKQLLIGGDVLSVAHIRRALQALPDAELINGYGPTENTTFTCCYRIPRDWPDDRSIPIGRPIRNTQVRILDERMQPVPIGVPGDLYASGDGLSLGYLNKPELTTAAFLEHQGERIYRTGDRARWLPTGDIDFLGRRDTQVKVRGFRVEIGEVEAALRRVPAVLDAAVAVHADSGGSKQLVAYVVARPGQQIDPAAVKSELASALPDHSIPSVIIPLADLPLGPNGKVNRGALPGSGSLENQSGSTAAGTETQARLAEIFQKILELPSISIDDNFFHCGGESLRATRAISQINRAFDCQLTLPRLFEAPTIRQMARVVEASSGKSVESSRVKSRAGSGTSPIEVEGLSDEEVDALLNQLVESNDPAESTKQTV